MDDLLEDIERCGTVLADLRTALEERGGELPDGSARRIALLARAENEISFACYDMRHPVMNGRREIGNGTYT